MQTQDPGSVKIPDPVDPGFMCLWIYVSGCHLFNISHSRSLCYIYIVDITLAALKPADFSKIVLNIRSIWEVLTSNYTLRSAKRDTMEDIRLYRVCNSII